MRSYLSRSHMLIQAHPIAHVSLLPYLLHMRIFHLPQALFLSPFSLSTPLAQQGRVAAARACPWSSARSPASCSSPAARWAPVLQRAFSVANASSSRSRATRLRPGMLEPSSLGAMTHEHPCFCRLQRTVYPARGCAGFAALSQPSCYNGAPDGGVATSTSRN